MDVHAFKLKEISFFGDYRLFGRSSTLKRKKKPGDFFVFVVVYCGARRHIKLRVTTVINDVGYLNRLALISCPRQRRPSIILRAHSGIIYYLCKL